MDKLLMKFVALNVDFDGPSQGNLRMRASKSVTPVKVVILALLASLSLKRLHIGMGMLPITTNTSDELYSCINIDDFKKPWIFKKGVFIDFYNLRLQRTCKEWTVMKWLEIDR